MKKKLSVLLALLVCISTCFGGVTVANAQASTAVVRIGNTNYASWTDAIREAKDGDILVALSDTNETIKLNGEKGIGIDFGTYTYTGDFAISNKSAMTILGGTFIAPCRNSTAYSQTNNGVLNIRGGVFKPIIFNSASVQLWDFVIENYGRVNLFGGKFVGGFTISNRANEDSVYGDTYVSGGDFQKYVLNKSYTSYPNIYPGNTDVTGHLYVTGGIFPSDATFFKPRVLEGVQNGYTAVERKNNTFIVLSKEAAVSYIDDTECDVSGHLFTPTFTWSSDGKSCIGTLVCKRFINHIVKGIKCNITSEVKKVATSTETGITLYKASFSYEGKMHVDTKEVQDIPVIVEDEVKKGETVDISLKKSNASSAKYTVASTVKNTVTYTKPNTTKKTAKIPDSIKDENGKTYKVTSIAKGAFKNNKKITEVIIGKNVTTIGKNAFSGAKSIKRITLNGNATKSIGKNAFKNVMKNCKIVIQAKNKKQYKKIVKMVKKSGAKKVKFIYKKKK